MYLLNKIYFQAQLSFFLFLFVVLKNICSDLSMSEMHAIFFSNNICLNRPRHIPFMCQVSKICTLLKKKKTSSKKEKEKKENLTKVTNEPL